MDPGVGATQDLLRLLTTVVVRLSAVAGTVLLAGCQAGYYAHLVSGQYDLLSRRVSIEEVLQKPETPPDLRAALATALDARRFAVASLALPDNDSYTRYADLERPYAIWNVMATPELSLEPIQWCYPFMGCFAYRGYYDEERAREMEQELVRDGRDVVVAGVSAYSTLGWFDDPVLNTMLGGTPERLVALVFHELAHQRLHIKDDTAFNESFARFVEEQGLREYLASQPQRAGALLEENRRRDEFVALILEVRERLKAVYADDAPAAARREQKAGEFRRLRQRYAELRERWGGDGRYDGWMSQALNNASLLPFGLYHEWVPAFTALYGDTGSSWPAFYARCEQLAALDAEARHRELERWKSRGLRL